jgi:ESCRT-I complex subunit TSG101
MAFVVPTKEMGVRKGREVEPGGRVREEIVEVWWKSYEVGVDLRGCRRGHR